MGRRSRGHASGTRPRPGPWSTLPAELWSLVLSKLDCPVDRSNVAASCSALAAAAELLVRRVACPIGERRPTRVRPWQHELLVVGEGETPERLPAILAALDEEWAESEGGCSAGSISSRALGALLRSAAGTPAPAGRAPLLLTLAVPGLALPTKHLARLLGGLPEGLRFSEVRVARGAAALDGALQQLLTRAAVRAPALVPWLKVGARAPFSAA